MGSASEPSASRLLLDGLTVLLQLLVHLLLGNPTVNSVEPAASNSWPRSLTPATSFFNIFFAFASAGRMCLTRVNKSSALVQSSGSTLAGSERRFLGDGEKSIVGNVHQVYDRQVSLHPYIQCAESSEQKASAHGTNADTLLLNPILQ